MKMVKCLLLAGAAGIAAASGAQAADLPVKARAAEYVKVCSAYGAGFYYIPGTDTCLKVGGYLYMDYDINSNGNHGPYWSGGNARDTRQDSPGYNTRVRTEVSFDARTQTEWGTLRSYIRGGWELNSNTTNPFSASGGIVTEGVYRGPTQFSRAFIQFAGFTVGKTQSFFDFYGGALGYNTPAFYAGSATGHGINLAAYTMQFGGGFSATVSLEETNHRRTGLLDGSNAAALQPQSVSFGGAGPNYGFYRAAQYPDVVANLRLDQPWGSAQVMGAIHDASGSCRNNLCSEQGGLSLGNATGYAVGGGIKFNLPFAAGDELWLQGTYAKGAVSYLGPNKFNGADSFAIYRGGAAGAGGATFTSAMALDGVADVTGKVNMTTGYQFTVAAQHYWTPGLRTSVFGGYMNLKYGAGGAAAFCTGTALAGVRPAGCNPDWSAYQIGTRTVWSPVANLDIGVEVLYSKINQQHTGSWTLAAAGSRPAGTYVAADADMWTGTVRVTRNFWP